MALLPGKIDRYRYLTGEEIFLSGQSRTIEQAEFTYSPLGTGFEKQTDENKEFVFWKKNIFKNLHRKTWKNRWFK